MNKREFLEAAVLIPGTEHYLCPLCKQWGNAPLRHYEEHRKAGTLMTPQEEAAAWAEYKSALPDDEAWTRLSAEVREAGFLAFLEEAVAHNGDENAFRCEDTMHQMHTYDVCGDCGTIWNRSA